MNNSQNHLGQFTTSAMEALKRAYEECPNSTSGSFIIIASNAVIRLENELRKGNTLCRQNRSDDSNHFHNGYSAAA